MKVLEPAVIGILALFIAENCAGQRPEGSNICDIDEAAWALEKTTT